MGTGCFLTHGSPTCASLYYTWQYTVGFPTWALSFYTIHPAGSPLHIPLCLSTPPSTEAPLTFHLPGDSFAALSGAELVVGVIRGRRTVTAAELSLRTVLTPAGGVWVLSWGLGLSPGAVGSWASGSHQAWHTQQAVGGSSAWVRG